MYLYKHKAFNKGMWLAALATTLLLHCNTAADACKLYDILHDGILLIIAHIWLCNMRIYFSSPNKYIWGRLMSLMLSSIFCATEGPVNRGSGVWLTIEWTNESAKVGGLLEVSSNSMHHWCFSKPLFVFFFLLSVPRLSTRWRPMIKYTVYLPRFFAKYTCFFFFYN